MRLERGARDVSRKHSRRGKGDAGREVGKVGLDPGLGLDRETRVMAGAGIREIGIGMEEDTRPCSLDSCREALFPLRLVFLARGIWEAIWIGRCGVSLVVKVN